MAVLSRLRKFNVVALSIVLVLTLLGMAAAAVGLYRNSWSDDVGYPEIRTSDAPVVGERIAVGDHVVMMFANGALHGKFRTDVRFIDGRSGLTTHLVANPDQQIYGGKVIGLPSGSEDFPKYGYTALAKTGEQNGRPLFDLLFIRFSDMKTIKLASQVLTFDVAMELDGKSFSAIVWGADDKARFVIVDGEAGKIVMERDLGLREKPLDAPNDDAAPRTQYR